MGYKNKIIRCVVKFKNISPFVIGTGEDGIENILIEDKKSKIPATTISGLFRAFLKRKGDNERLYKAVYLENYSGDQIKQAHRKNRKQSMLILEDSYSQGDIDYNKDIGKRTNIKIDDEMGVSDNNHLFDTYYLLPNQSYKLEIEMRKFKGDIAKDDIRDRDKRDLEQLDERDEKLLEDLKNEFIDFLAGVNSHQIRIGANGNKGFGKFEIDSCLIKEYDLTKQEDLSSYLSRKDSELTKLNLKESNNRDIIKIKFSCPEGLLIKGEEEIKGEHSVQMPYKEEGKYKIPASTIKGQLRAYVNRFDNNRLDDLEKLVFGNTEQRGLLRFEDITIENCGEIERTRIKIDRFTGGTINGALVKERLINWKDKRYSLDFDISFLKGDIKDKLKNILYLFVLDMKNGKIRLGSGKGIGYGKLEYIDSKGLNNGKQV